MIVQHLSMPARSLAALSHYSVLSNLFNWGPAAPTQPTEGGYPRVALRGVPDGMADGMPRAKLMRP